MLNIEVLRESAFNLARKLAGLRVYSEIEHVRDLNHKGFKHSYDAEEVANLLEGLLNDINNLKY